MMQELNLGKIPPQDVELEKAVLGAVIMEPEQFLRVIDLLSPLDFYRDAHVKIFDCLCNMFAMNKPIDMLTLVNELRRTEVLEEVGGAHGVSKLMENIASAAHVEYHARIISELAMRRDLIEKASKLIKDAFDDSSDFDTVMNNTVNLVDSVIEKTHGGGQVMKFVDAAQLYVDKLNEYQRSREKGAVGGITSHITTVRRIIPEYKPGNLIVVAARPSMGKTAIALNEMLNIALDGFPVAFFSLEMTVYELVGRLVQRESGMSQYDFERSLSPHDWEKIDRSISKLQNIGLFIDDTPGISFAYLKAKCKILKKTHGLKAICVDYLQLMSTDRRLPREQQIAVLSGQLKGLAKELDVPLFILSQLNRNSDQRASSQFKPVLSDLRESGAIEQDADMVMVPHRLEYYYKDDPEFRNKAQILILKHRGGAVGDADCLVNNTKTKWFSAEDAHAVNEVDDYIERHAVFVTEAPKINTETDRPF